MGQPDRITIEKLKGSSNFPAWKRKAKAILTREDYEEAIESDLSNSSDPDQKRRNSKAMASILLFCTDEVQIQISEYTSAFLAWQALEQTYNRSGFIAIYVLLKQFFSTSLNQFRSMEAFLYKIRNLRSELENHGIRLPEPVVISWTLFGLDTEYEPFVQNITQALRSDINAYTFDTLTSSLIDEARGKEVISNERAYLARRKVEEEEALLARKFAKKQRNSPPYCQNCKKSGHSSDSCWFLHPGKAPKGWKQPNSKNRVEKRAEKSEFSINRAKQDALIARITENINTENADNTDEEVMMTSKLPKLTIQEEEEDTEVRLPNKYNKKMANKMLDGLKTLKLGGELARKDRKLKIRFIIDSAATINTIADLQNFTSYKPYKTIVRWGEANNLTSQYRGEVTIKLNTGYIYTLKNVLYLPELGVNLMSLDKMPDIISLFMKNKAYLYKNHKIVAIGYKSNSLYYTEAQLLSKNIEKIQISKEIRELEPNKENIITQWHIRLGHMNIKALKYVLDANNIAINLQDINNFLANKCKTCLLAKNNRYINKISSNPTEYDILDRIHTNLGGPLPPTYNKYTYYITFLDKKSRYL
jgi:hypothetical protein